MKPLIIQTHFLIHLTLTIHRRMWRHPAIFKCTRIIRITLPSTHHLIALTILQITIYQIHIRRTENIRNMFDGIGRKQHIIRVHKSNYIARCHLNTFIDSIIYSTIFFRYPTHLPCTFVFTLLHFLSICLNKFFRAIFRRPIHYNMLNIRIGLRQHTLKCIGKCLCTIISNGNNGYFHIH